MKYGRGKEKFPNGNFYKGYFRESYRYGRGSMYFGHVQEKVNTLTSTLSVTPTPNP